METPGTKALPANLLVVSRDLALQAVQAVVDRIATQQVVFQNSSRPSSEQRRIPAVHTIAYG